MKESVLTKRLNNSVIKPPGTNMMIIGPYDDKMDIEMLERLQSLQSPVDEQRRLVQEKVINKHRLETEKQYWLEKDNYTNGNKVLRKAMSMNDLQKYNQQQHNPRMRRMPRSYLQIHHERMADDAKSDGSSNASSRTASSQDNYPQFYIGDQRINRGETSGSRLSLVQMESISSLDPLLNRSENYSRDSYASIHSQTSWRNEIPGNFSNPSRYLNQPVTINSSRSEHPSMNKNFTRAQVYEPEVMSARLDVSHYRPERAPIPNINNYRDEKIVITMTADEKVSKISKSARQDRKGSNASTSSIKSEKLTTKPSKSEKSIPTPPKDKQTIPVNQARNEKISNNNNNSNSVSRLEKTISNEKSANNVLFSESRVPGSTQSKPAKQTTRSVSKNSGEKSTPPPNTARGENKKNGASRRTPPEWYERINNENFENGVKSDKNADTTPSKGKKSPGNNQTVNDSKKQKIQTASQSKPPQEPSTYDASKKPRQSSLKKSSSFKLGASLNFFGYMSVDGARGSPKKKVTFSNEETDRPGTA